MGSSCFICKDEITMDQIQSMNPEEWTQSEVCQWLKYSNNGDFKPFIQAFKRNKISGLTFISLTHDDLKYKLGIKQLGLRDSFIVCRDELIKQNIHQSEKPKTINTINTDITTHSVNKYYEIQSNTPQSRQSPPSTQSPHSAISSFDNSDYVLDTPSTATETSYFDLSCVIINGFCRKYVPITDWNKINSLCFDFYFVFENYINRFSFDLWKTLTMIKIKTLLRNNHNNDTISGFTGYELVKHMQQHLIKYNTDDIQQLCAALVKYSYIRLVAIIRNTGVNILTKNENYFVCSNDHLYQFENDKHRMFVKQHEPDRMAWFKGCLVHIYSETLRGWNIGKIIDINVENDSITVEYEGNMRKTVHRYDDNNIIKSTNEFIYNRQNWELDCEIMVFSNKYERWYKGKIIQVLLKNNREIRDLPFDILQVYYRNHQGTEFKKYVARWSSDLRSTDLRETVNMLSIFKLGSNIMVWSDSAQIWMRGIIVGVVQQPCETLINVRYGHLFEKTLPWNSNDLRFGVGTIAFQLLNSCKNNLSFTQ